MFPQNSMGHEYPYDYQTLGLEKYSLIFKENMDALLNIRVKTVPMEERGKKASKNFTASYAKNYLFCR